MVRDGAESSSVDEGFAGRGRGKTLRVLIEERESSGAARFTGRTQMDAPEVDGVTYVGGNGIKAGDFMDVRITGTMEYDLVGEAV